MTDRSLSADALAPAVSVVTVAYRTGPALRTCLEAVAAQSVAVQHVVVDNGGDAEQTALLDAWAAAARITLIRGQGNVGFARACNLGAGRARAPRLLFLNPDCAPPADFAATLMAASAGLAPPWIVGGVPVDEAGKDDPACARGPLTPLSALSQGLGLPKIWPGAPRFLTRAPDAEEGITPVAAVSGACLMTDRASFRALHGFDEGYFLHVEDIDLCARAADAGGDVVVCAAARTPHARSTSAEARARIERCKAEGFTRFFKRRYGDVHPLALLARFGAHARARIRSLSGR